jgi:hypothetical protein
MAGNAAGGFIAGKEGVFQSREIHIAQLDFLLFLSANEWIIV